MPINRSPPTTPATPVAAPEKPKTSDQRTADTKESASKSGPIRINLCDAELDLQSLTSNIAERNKSSKKRKLNELVGENADIAAIIGEMFKVFSKEQELHFQELKDSMELMSNKHDEFLVKIVSLEKERKADRLLIQELEEKLETLERKSRSTGIEIRNIPKQNDETKEKLCSEVIKLGKTLNVEIDGSKIQDIYRLKSKDSSNPVIVNLTTVLLKDSVLRAAKHFNKSKPREEKLNTTHINSKYQPKPLYIAETLTQKNQRLYFLARQFQKSHGYNFCWTANGIVYLKNTEGSAHIRINTDADINKLRNST